MLSKPKLNPRTPTILPLLLVLGTGGLALLAQQKIAGFYNIILPTVLVAAMVWLASRGLSPLLKLARIRRWEPVSATIISAATEELVDGELVFYRPRLRYRYELDGKTFENNQPGITENAFDLLSAQAMQEFMAPLVTGAPISLRVSPDDPACSVMQPGCSPYQRSHYLAMVASAIVVACVLAFIL